MKNDFASAVDFVRRHISSGRFLFDDVGVILSIINKDNFIIGYKVCKNRKKHNDTKIIYDGLNALDAAVAYVDLVDIKSVIENIRDKCNVENEIIDV